MYVVVGASGNTGSVVAEKLLEKNEKVRVVGREANRLARFTQKGGEAIVANVSNAAALTEAFTGAKAAYAMIPPNISSPDVRASQEQVSDALASSIERSGLKHVVVLSSFGADKPDKTGPVVGLHNLETKLNGINGLNVLYLRAGYFMTNLLPQASVIQTLGMMAGPVNPDVPLPMIATHDIGAVAAETLLKLDFQGKNIRELQGARDVTYAEAAKMIGAAIGKPDIAYARMPSAQLKPALMQMGMSSNMADLLLEMADALNSRYMKMLEPRSPANTTPTTLETFVAEKFVSAYRGKAARV